MSDDLRTPDAEPSPERPTTGRPDRRSGRSPGRFMRRRTSGEQPMISLGRTRSRRHLLPMALTAAIVLGIDQLSKHWALNRLDDGSVIDLVGSLRFRLAFNTGASFSLGEGQGIGPWVSVLALVIIVVLAVSFATETRMGSVTAGLIAGGALGNLADRLFRSDDGFLDGAVVDFIDLQFWPVFNVADIGVVLGGILLVLVSLREASE